MNLKYIRELQRQVKRHGKTNDLHFATFGVWICRECEEEKKEDDFVKDNSYKSGRSTLCRVCRNAYQRKRLERLKAK